MMVFENRSSNRNRNRNRNRNHLSYVYSRTKTDFFYNLNLNINIFHILISLFLFLLLFFLQLLLYVIDSAGGDNGGSGGNEPAADLRALWKELKLYDEDLLKKPAMIFANKSDLHCQLIIYFSFHRILLDVFLLDYFDFDNSLFYDIFYYSFQLSLNLISFNPTLFLSIFLWYGEVQ